MRRPRLVLLAALALLGSFTASAAPAGAAEPARYVALGDSYVAGPLIPVQTGLPPGCLRSTRNYPSVVADAIGAGTLVDASCSGATTADLTAPQEVLGGQNPPQLEALTAGTDLVTMSMGGNDIGFAEIIQECTTRSPLDPHGAACEAYYTRTGTDELAERIAATAPKIAAGLAGIAERSPQARVLLVGYPAIVPDSGPGCFPVVPFSAGDVAYLRKIGKALNAMVAAEADAADVEFVDTYTPSIGRDVCAPPGVRWVEGLVPVEPAAPVHPNARGMAGMAAAVVDELGLS